LNFYDFSAVSMYGEEIKFDIFKNKVVIIVNTASHCGFTSQFDSLQRLYDRYKDKDFVILGFPCNQFAEQEPASNEDVLSFCTLNYGVSFPMFQKINVRDENAHPLFTYLTSIQPFKGFDHSHPVTKGLLAFLKDKHPEYLIGDSIKWNFTKFLIDKKGNVFNRYESTFSPAEIEKHIVELLTNKSV
jgi:glutathione peroxidase